MKNTLRIATLFALALIAGMASAQTRKPTPKAPPVPSCDPNDQACVLKWACTNNGSCDMSVRGR